MAHFCHQDLTDALALVQAASLAGDGSDPFPESILELLRLLIPGEVVTYQERETCTCRLLLKAQSPAFEPSSGVDFPAESPGIEFPAAVERRIGETRPLKVSDYASTRELLKLDFYSSPLQVLRMGFQLRLWLMAPPGIARYFSISRRHCDGDFSERDRELLELLRPFLDARRQRFETKNAQQCVGGLTGRETEILGWVARGKTNKEIAELLVMSPHTVRKHLENTFEKLRVHTRTAAIARAFPSNGSEFREWGWTWAAIAAQSVAMLS